MSRADTHQQVWLNNHYLTQKHSSSRRVYVAPSRISGFALDVIKFRLCDFGDAIPLWNAFENYIYTGNGIQLFHQRYKELLVTFAGANIWFRLSSGNLLEKRFILL